MSMHDHQALNVATLCWDPTLAEHDHQALNVAPLIHFDVGIQLRSEHDHQALSFNMLPVLDTNINLILLLCWDPTTSRARSPSLHHVCRPTHTNNHDPTLVLGCRARSLRLIRVRIRPKPIVSAVCATVAARVHAFTWLRPVASAAYTQCTQTLLAIYASNTVVPNTNQSLRDHGSPDREQ
ncbi:hypothetical protein J6590_015279 [Homalodisca vitripennis]|nr:hypothetical protein J6590_015279 [Homalodisca vitripennis]